MFRRIRHTAVLILLVVGAVLVALASTPASAQPASGSSTFSPPALPTLRGFNFNPQVVPSDAGFPWLMFYSQYRTRITTELQELVSTTNINFIDLIVLFPWTLKYAHQAPQANQPLAEWASIPFLDNLAMFIDDCHGLGVSVEVDLANHMWIPYSVDSENHHVGYPGDPWWPVADETPWDESATWYTQIINYIEGKVVHPEGIAMWCMFGSYVWGGAEPTLFSIPEMDPAIISNTEMFVKNVWPAFKAAGARPKASPIMLPIFLDHPTWALPEERLSAFTNLKTWLVDDLALPPDYWVMTTWPFCDPAPDGFYYLEAIIGILGSENASRLISTDFGGPGHEESQLNTIISTQGYSGPEMFEWQFRKCAQYGLAGWWIYTYQDYSFANWGIRDLAGNWKWGLVDVIKEQSLNRIRCNVGLIEAGRQVVLTAPIGVDYHWYQNNDELTGQTSRTLTFDPIEEIDGGAYVCTYKYGDTVIPTAPLVVQVWPEGSLPVAGVAGLGFIGVAMLLSGVALMRRRRKAV